MAKDNENEQNNSGSNNTPENNDGNNQPQATNNAQSNTPQQPSPIQQNNQTLYQQSNESLIANEYTNKFNDIIKKYGSVNEIVNDNTKLNALKEEAIANGIIVEANGNSLEAVSKNNAVTMKAVDKGDQVEINTRSKHFSTTQSYNNPKKKEGLSAFQIFLICLAIACIIAALIILIVSLTKKKEEEKKEEQKPADKVQTTQSDNVKDEKGGTVQTEDGKNITITTEVGDTTDQGNKIPDDILTGVKIEENPNVGNIIKDSNGNIINDHASGLWFDKGNCNYSYVDESGKLVSCSIPIDQCQVYQNGTLMSKRSMYAANLYNHCTKQFEINGNPISLDEVNNYLNQKCGTNR